MRFAIVGFLLLFVAVVPVSASYYEQISLGQIADADLSFNEVPTGNLTYGGVPFFIPTSGNQTFCTEDGGNGQGRPTTGTLTTNIAEPVNLYILIAGACVSNSFLGMPVGCLSFTYSDGSRDYFDLVVGDTIRDWVAVPGVVTTTTNPNIATMWSNIQPGTPYEQVIDMLKIPLRSDKVLTSIGIIDTSETSVENINPSILVWGITVESPVPEPSSLLALGSGLFSFGFVLRRRKH